MSFQELGSLGEFVAAIATVATLIYLALQIKMNNRLAVSNIENQLNSRECERRLAIALDNEFSSFLAKDWGKERFTPTERTQAAQYITMLVIDVREAFLQNKLGFVSRELLENRMIRLNMGIMRSEVAKSVWATYKITVEADFAAYFEARIFPEGLETGLEESHPQYKKAQDS
jgi:hypothetical protein